MARIFISYATPDRVIADEVSGWLRAAGHEPFLDHDLHDGISPGEDWKQRRRTRTIAVLSTLLLLVTAASIVAFNNADTTRRCHLQPDHRASRPTA